MLRTEHFWASLTADILTVMTGEDWRAGESAAARAKRIRERAETLRNEAARLDQQAGAWEAGEQGELAVASALAPLRARGWVLLHDRRKHRSSTANLDHIAIGPPGVFLVDAKNWSGRVSVGPDTFFCAGRPRMRELDAVVAQAVQLREELACDGIVVTSYGVLAMVQGNGLSQITASRSGTVAPLAGLAEALLRLPAVLDESEVRRAAARLDYLHPPRSEPIPRRTQTRTPAWVGAGSQASPTPTGAARTERRRGPSRRELRRQQRERAERRRTVAALGLLLLLLVGGKPLMSLYTSAVSSATSGVVKSVIPTVPAADKPTPGPRR